MIDQFSSSGEASGASKMDLCYCYLMATKGKAQSIVVAGLAVPTMCR